MKVHKDRIDTNKTKRSTWYDHLWRINDNRWPKMVWQKQPKKKLKSRRHQDDGNKMLKKP